MQEGLTSPSAFSSVPRKGLSEEQDGAGEPWPEGRGRTAPFLGRPLVKRGVAAADAHRVQFPGEQKDWYPAEAMRQAADDAHVLAVHDSCNTDPKE